MAEKKGDLLTTILAILMLLEIAGLAGGAGYLVLTKKITAEQARLFAKVYEGGINEQVAADAESWKKHQAEEQGAKEREVSGADAVAKLAAGSEAAAAAELGVERQLKEIEAREKSLQLKFEELALKRKELEDIQQRIDQKLAADRAGTGQKSFQKMLEILTAMKPPQIKEVLVKMDEPTVVEILKAVDARVAAKVLAEYKTPAEIDQKKRLLEAINDGKVINGKMISGGAER